MGIQMILPAPTTLTDWSEEGREGYNIWMETWKIFINKKRKLHKREFLDTVLEEIK